MAFNLADVLKDVSAPDTGLEQIQYIPLNQLDEDPDNFYQLSDIPELADNIALCGLQQPIRVRQKEDGRYIIVSGHRRRAALEMLVADGYDYFSKAACIVERDEVSPTLQQLRLIYANASTRKMTNAEIGEQAAQVEKLLYQLKEEGFDFPGRMRDHVAQAVSQSKSKLARLKVIRENLSPVWASAFQRNLLAESTAYELAQLPEKWQSVIYGQWGLYPGNLHANDVKTFKGRFEKVVDIQCQHGLNFCEHSVTMMEQNVKERYMPKCEKCCFECSSLQTCGKCCPEAKARKAELKAIAKQASLDAAEKEAKRQQPYIDMARLVYERVGIARDRNRVSVEQLYKAQKRFYNSSTDDKRQKDYERGVGTFSDNTDLPFGYSVRASLLITIRDVADALGCSVDYLLGRTEDRESHLSVPVEPAPVSYPGTTWNAGNPPKIGKYLVWISFGKYFDDRYEMLMWDGCEWHDGAQIHEPEYDGDVLGWIPMPREQEDT